MLILNQPYKFSENIGPYPGHLDYFRDVYIIKIDF